MYSRECASLGNTWPMVPVRGLDQPIPKYDPLDTETASLQKLPGLLLRAAVSPEFNGVKGSGSGQRTIRQGC